MPPEFGLLAAASVQYGRPVPWIGALKYTGYEAAAIQPPIAHSVFPGPAAGTS
jgi:hypothetical protein